MDPGKARGLDLPASASYSAPHGRLACGRVARRPPRGAPDSENEAQWTRFMPTSTVEDYLKQIFLAQQARVDQPVPTSRIAASLNVSQASATTMVKALAQAGLVRYRRYAGALLTTAGRDVATGVLRRHRIVELFLVRVMGMSWSEVHQDAELLEHVISDRLLARIDAMLGHPSFDPHGDPIPTLEGTVPSPHSTCLLECVPGQVAVIARVLDQRADFLRQLELQRLFPGTPIRVQARSDAALTIAITTSSAAPVELSFRDAGRIMVYSAVPSAQPDRGGDAGR
ncbi:MAG: metal-dependent transcriptional regulator [Candidatus Schekmanbacteria bacterium]|nr:metal-dependent transcriptional regulator [Candidatus Schekmanbacteria bacterium]